MKQKSIKKICFIKGWPASIAIYELFVESPLTASKSSSSSWLPSWCTNIQMWNSEWNASRPSVILFLHSDIMFFRGSCLQKSRAFLTNYNDYRKLVRIPFLMELSCYTTTNTTMMMMYDDVSNYKKRNSSN